MQLLVHPLGKHSRRVKELRRRLRKREGEIILDGRRLLADALSSGVKPREIYCSSTGLGALEEMPLDASTGVFLLDDDLFIKLAPTRQSQGILAFATEPELNPWTMRKGLGVYLEGVQDPSNVGGIIRSAAALGADAVWLSPGCANPFTPVAVRASAGAIFRLPVERNLPLDELFQRSIKAGAAVWAAAGGGQSIDAVDAPGGPLVLLFGAEGAGLSAAALEAADRIIGIRLDSGVESLNVSVAVGVILAAVRNILRC